MRRALLAQPLSAVIRLVTPGAGIIFTGQPWKACARGLTAGSRGLTGVAGCLGLTACLAVCLGRAGAGAGARPCRAFTGTPGAGRGRLDQFRSAPQGCGRRSAAAGPALPRGSYRAGDLVPGLGPGFRPGFRRVFRLLVPG